ncbi:MAG: GlsB/YeaQ/YmgE family stress response membrane protein [Acidobacteriota bacterium]|nr:GlsB/YeaQ/YmgE family stress response membrane protein [Acidobacteriota bacterium]
MDATGLLIFLLVGAAAGWIAGNLMRGGGFGLVGNIVVGIIGAFLGSWLLGLLKVSIGSGLINSLVTSVIGAVVLLFLVGLVKKA